MSFLEKIHKGKRNVPFRAVIYGEKGIGKSTWACDSDSPIIFDIEDGISQINTDSLFLAESTSKQISYALRELFESEHEYKTLVIDSIDFLERKIHEEIAENENVKDISDIGYGKGYEKALYYFNKLLVNLELLRRQKNMNIILVGHRQKMKVEEPGQDPYDHYTLKLNKHVVDLIQNWADCILYAKTDLKTIKTGEKFGNEKFKAIGGNNHILCTKNTPAYSAKNRYGLPEILPLEFQAFKQAMEAGKK